ncbi:AMP-activated serine/threonine-protein kinase regulatory subunit SNF4 [Aspergillus mulundensis]|uniref:CBS domain-containing protein n=1 Tax=Aspergillus mulundensis TaxID=1810919 RepID=A0A3D8QN41_9EURO|nr:hypothetical protein DSM5745_10209 [Aspergillus mulundensis]RDW63098.1 hypothetical protein DSM5745_10209 [Aspergillus mulundensis]
MASVSEGSSHRQHQQQHRGATGRISGSCSGSGLPPPANDTTTTAITASTASAALPSATHPDPDPDPRSSTFCSVSTLPPVPLSDPHPHPPPPLAICGHEGGFVQPSSYLRSRRPSYPMPATQPERAIDREERQGLRAIRNFLKVRTSYDVLPLSFRLIVFDTALTVKESLNILTQNGIVSAPLWDSKSSTFAGLLTTSDYINVIQYYFQNPAALDKIDQLRLDSLREVERALDVAPPETISIDPERPLYEACRRMLESRARRIPLVTNDSQTDRHLVLSVITQYRILKFVAVNVSDTQKLRKPLGEIRLGSYHDIATASMDTPVIDVIHILVQKSISSVPIVNSEGVVYNVFESVDVVTLIKGGAYDDLSLTVGEALKKRSSVRVEFMFSKEFADRARRTSPEFTPAR